MHNFGNKINGKIREYLNWEKNGKTNIRIKRRLCQDQISRNLISSNICPDILVPLTNHTRHSLLAIKNLSETTTTGWMKLSESIFQACRKFMLVRKKKRKKREGEKKKKRNTGQSCTKYQLDKRDEIGMRMRWIRKKKRERRFVASG